MPKLTDAQVKEILPPLTSMGAECEDVILPSTW